MKKSGAWAKWMAAVCAIATGMIAEMAKGEGNYCDGVSYSIPDGDWPAGVYSVDYDVKSANFLSLAGWENCWKVVETICSRAAYQRTALEAIHIPASIKTVEDEAFEGCTSLDNLTVPTTVTTWGEEVFAGCTGLKNLTLPAGLTKLGWSMFSGCTGLPSVTIPASLTDWGVDAFSGCSGLTNVTLPEGLSSVGAGAFSECYLLGRVAFPSSMTKVEERAFSGCTALAAVDFGGVEEIGGKAFAGCTGMKVLSFPEGVKEIGAGAFSGCSGLATVAVPGGVEEIGAGAFSGVPVKTLYFDNARGELLGAFSKESLRVLYLGADTRGVAGEALEDCMALAAVLVAKENAEYVVDGTGALYDKGMTRLIRYPSGSTAETFTVPPTVRTVDPWAFAHATALREVEFQGPVTSIGEGAFDWCLALERVAFPDRVAAIGEGAFGVCPSLETLRFGATGTAATSFAGGQFAHGKPTVEIEESEWARWQTTLSALGLPHAWIEHAVQTVTFDANGGTCGTASAEYAAGKAYGSLPEAQKAEWTFVGWWTGKAGGMQVTAESVATEEATRTLYARWAQIQTVTFNANGGTCPAAQAEYWTPGTYEELPVAQKGVYPFVGWFTAPSAGVQVKAGDATSDETSRTLYAHWAKNQTVTFDANGGTCSVSRKGYWTPGAYGTLPTPTNGVKPFLGWFTAAEGGERVKVGDATTSASARTLYAHWASNQTVTFNANGGTCNVSKKGYWTPGTYATLPTATRDGFVFAGWFTAASGGTQVKAGDATTSASARTLYAHWTTAKQKSAAGITGIAVAPGTDGVKPRGTFGGDEGGCILLVDAQADTEYEVQWVPELGGEWTAVKRWTAEADGECEVEVPLRAGENGAGFYRVAGSE